MRNVNCLACNTLENDDNSLGGNKGGNDGNSRSKMSNIDEVVVEDNIDPIKDNSSPTEELLSKGKDISSTHSQDTSKSGNPVAEAILVINSLPLSQDEKASYVRTLMSSMK